MTPLMLIVFRFPPHVAVGTSMMMIFFSSVMSSIGHIFQGHVAWGYSIILIISSVIGANRCEGQSIYEIRHSCNVIENSNAYHGCIFNH